MSFVRKVLLMTAGVALTLPVVGAELTEKTSKKCGGISPIVVSIGEK